MGWEVAARAILAPGAAMQPGPWSCHAISAWMMVNSACLAAFSQNSIFLQMEMPMRQAASNSPAWSPDGIKLSALQNSVRSFQLIELGNKRTHRHQLSPKSEKRKNWGHVMRTTWWHMWVSEKREGEEVLWVSELRSSASHAGDYNTTNCFPAIHEIHGGCWGPHLQPMRKGANAGASGCWKDVI